MPEKNLELLERQVRTLRDWLIPSTLVVAICVSIILYIFSLTALNKLLKASVIASLLGIALHIYNLLHIFFVIGNIEDYRKQPPNWHFHISYLVSIVGILAFLVSLSLLCFTRSLLLGVLSATTSAFTFIIFIWWAIKNAPSA